MSSYDHHPFFSICVPVYNTKNYVEECLASVEGQSFEDYEVLVMDDGSTDGTTEVVRALASRFEDGKFRFLYSSENRGTYKTRLNLIDESRGKYVLFLDSDDAYVSGDVLLRIGDATQTLGLDILFFNATNTVNGSRLLVDYGKLASFNDGTLDPRAVKQFALDGYELNSLCFKAVRRTLLDGEARFHRRIDMCEDRLLSVQAILGASRFGLINQPMYYYRKNEGSVTRKRFYTRFFFDQMLVDRTLCSCARKEGLDVAGLYRMVLKVMCSDLRLCAGCSGSAKHKADFVELLESMRKDTFAAEALKENGLHALRPDERLLVRGVRGNWSPKTLYRMARAFDAAKGIIAR